MGTDGFEPDGVVPPRDIMPSGPCWLTGLQFLAARAAQVIILKHPLALCVMFRVHCHALHVHDVLHLACLMDR